MELKESSELSTDEQAVVEEFCTVIRKHPERSPARLVRLVGLAFSRSMERGGTRDAKLERARTRGLLARQELAEAEGGSLSSEAVSSLLGISKTAVLKRLKTGKLLAWREERLQAARFPKWQFDEHGQVLAGLEEVLGTLDSEGRLDVWGKVLFFLQERASLNGKRPLDLLRSGNLTPLKLAAQAYAE